LSFLNFFFAIVLLGTFPKETPFYNIINFSHAEKISSRISY